MCKNFFFFDARWGKYTHLENIVYIPCEGSFKAIFLKVSFRGYWAQMMFREIKKGFSGPMSGMLELILGELIDLEKQRPLYQRQGSPDSTELQAELQMTPRTGP